MVENPSNELLQARLKIANDIISRLENQIADLKRRAMDPEYNVRAVIAAHNKDIAFAERESAAFILAEKNYKQKIEELEALRFLPKKIVMVDNDVQIRVLKYAGTVFIDGIGYSSYAPE